MGRYSDSDSSRSSRHKKHKKSSRRSSRGRSRSPSSKRCKKKEKKYKKSTRSNSRDERSRYSSDSKSKHRRRSRSRSTSRRRKRSSSRDSSRDRRRKDEYKKSKYSKSKKKYRSSSSSSSSSSFSSKSKSPTPVRKFDYDPDELLEKLNKAAVEAMAANKKSNPESLASSIEMQIKRHDIINEIRSGSSNSLDTTNLNAPTAPLISSKLTDNSGLEDTPVVVDLNVSGFTVNSSSNSEPVESFLHPNFMLENQEEKLNRWVKKLFLIRQRALSGELI